MEHPQVFMDIKVGNQLGKVVMELFPQLPITVQNFRDLCTGVLGLNLHYKGRSFPRIIPEFMMQGGKIVPHNDGIEAQSTFGPKFADEGIWMPHTHPGILSMANAGPNTNGSSFFICYGPAPHLDGKHAVFGRVIHGFAICRYAE